MMNLIKVIFIWVLLIAVPKFSYAQNFNSIFDIDSCNNIGNDIFIDQDGSFIILGDKIKATSAFTTLKITQNGNAILNENTFNVNPGSSYAGYVGRKKKLSSGYYLSPFNIQYASTSVTSVNGGYVILDATGSPISTNLYNTDTANYSLEVYDVIQLPDSGYMAGGISVKKATRFATGTILRTDKAGNTIWIKNYPYSGYQTHINSLDLINSNMVLIGGSVDDRVVIGNNDPQYYFRPRFMKINIDGNVLKDTAYMTGYSGRSVMGGGNIFKDRNGGYYHYGQLSTIYDSSHADGLLNYPDYLMHMDDNFQINWITPFYYFPGHKYIWTVRQLHDNNYLVLCSSNKSGINNSLGWAAKINRDGYVIWDNIYYYDSLGQNYFTDAIELNDGSIVFTGYIQSTLLPVWHAYDLWVLKVDSNGCALPGCTPTNIRLSSQENTKVKMYPNPFNEQLTISNLEPGTSIEIYDLYGRHVYSSISSLDETCINTTNLQDGIYVVQLKNSIGINTIYKVFKR